MHKMAEIAAQEAERMRSNAAQRASKRKEDFLGARVPKELKERVMMRASELGIPVSLLIRKVLEDAFAEPGQALAQMADPIKCSAADRQTRLSSVLGWKSLELNRSHACDCCGQVLQAGNNVVMGVTPDNGMMIICGACKEQLKA
ncbi:MAG: BrnA antitoxin family protein [Gammaproteobacteria bacterium]|nr:BrnA antitoxin family protein [Gammaproteobacteria bacterium]